MSQIKTIMRNIAGAVRTRKGKVGAVVIACLVLFGDGLDLFHKGETLYRLIRELPAVVVIMHAVWFQPLLFVAGFVLLCRSAMEVKKKERPKTVEERMAEVEAWKARTLTATPTQSEIVKVYRSIPQQINTLNLIVQEHHRIYGDQIRALTVQMDALGQQTTGPDGPLEIRRSIVSLSELSILIQESGEALDLFREIRERFPDSDVAKWPFSTWLSVATSHRQLVPERDIEFGLSWARGLDSHVLRVQQWAERWSLAIEDNNTTVLIGFVSNWKAGRETVSGDYVRHLLQMHQQALFNRRHTLMEPSHLRATLNRTAS